MKTTEKRARRRLERLVRRIALSAELAWNEISGIAADFDVAVCGGTYEQHVEVLEEQIEREHAIRKKYAPNVQSSGTAAERDVEMKV